MMLRVYFDSQCPLCQMEMKQLKQHDHEQSIKLIDLHQQNFQQDFPHINVESAMAMLHGELNNGELIYGLVVTCQAWKLVGKHKWLTILRWPGIRTIADAFYLFFAKHRNKISYLLTGKQSCNC